MQKKKNTRLTINAVDFITGFICLTGMAVSLFLFQKDLNVSLSKLDETPVAVIYFKYNTAQRRLANHNLWERLRQASPIYDGDRIRTADLSEAYTVFSDGTKIDLHENTLIQVFGRKNQNSVNFIDGSITILSTLNPKQFSVRTGNKLLSIKNNTSAVLNYSKTDGLATIAVLTGAVELNPLSQTVSSDAAEKQTIEAGSSISFKPVTIDLSDLRTAPAENRQAVTVFIPSSTYSAVKENNTSSLSIPFVWQANDPLRVDFAYDKLFSNIVAVRMLPEGNTRASIILDFTHEGDVLYWRILPIHSGDKSSEDQELRKTPCGTIFVRGTEKVGLGQVAAAAFGTQVSQKVEEDVNAAEKITDAAVSGFSLVAMDVPSAVDVPAAESSEKTTASAELIKQTTKQKKQPLSVKKSKPGIVSLTPMLVNPKKGTVFTEKNFNENDPDIAFSWKPVKKAESYEFTLYKGKSTTTKPVFVITVKKPLYVLRGDNLARLDTGNFTWTITAVQKVNGIIWKSNRATSEFSVSIGKLGSVTVDKAELLDAH